MNNTNTMGDTFTRERWEVQTFDDGKWITMAGNRFKTLEEARLKIGKRHVNKIAHVIDFGPDDRQRRIVHVISECTVIE